MLEQRTTTARVGALHDRRNHDHHGVGSKAPDGPTFLAIMPFWPSLLY